MTWKLLKVRYDIDLIHCQKTKDDNRLTINKYSSLPGIFYISTETRFVRDLEKNETTNCPNCGQLVPDYILTQVKLLLN